MKFNLSLPLRPVQIFTGLLLGLSCCNAANASVSTEALVQMTKNNWAEARDIVTRSGDPELYNLYQWMLYREDFGGLPFASVAEFIRTHPDWPDMDKIVATAERNMPYNLSYADILTWFTARPPVSGEGLKRLMMVTADPTQLAPLIPILNTAWPTAKMTVGDQEVLFANFGRHISETSHRKRFDTLLKLKQYTLARSLAGQMQKGYPKLIEARIALIEQKDGVSGLVAQIPLNLKSDAGLMLDRLRWRRQQDDDAGALEILRSMPPLTQISFPEEWWKERNILVRRLIEDKNYQAAYTLASQHGMEKGSEFTEAEWLTGWLAFRFLHQPTIGLQHFSNLYNIVETAISKSRAAYWAGRAAEAAGLTKDAEIWFNLAANYPNSYYGQVSLTHLRRPIPNVFTAYSSPNQEKELYGDDFVRAAILLHEIHQNHLSSKFILAKTSQFKTAPEFAAFAKILNQSGNIEGAYLVAKRASWKNIYLGEVAYPSLLSKMQNLSIDPALVHGIIRQESQFDPEARSPAGALGLMQLMPKTAEEVARKRKWSHQTSWLIDRPEHNILLGSAYLNDLLGRFNGSYPMVIASYNAGPSRVRQWITTFGDPRAGEIDWIDWIELIPIAETRNYVQRVTEGVVIYRENRGMKPR